MASRGALKQLFRRFSSGSGKVLSEEEKAAENIYIVFFRFSLFMCSLTQYFWMILFLVFFSHQSFIPSHVIIEKVEQEKLEKLAHKGPETEEKAAPSPGGSSADAKPSSASSGPGISSAKVSGDSYKNYAIIGGALTVVGALGWYLKSDSKKSEEVKD